MKDYNVIDEELIAFYGKNLSSALETKVMFGEVINSETEDYSLKVLSVFP